MVSAIVTADRSDAQHFHQIIKKDINIQKGPGAYQFDSRVVLNSIEKSHDTEKIFANIVKEIGKTNITRTYGSRRFDRILDILFYLLTSVPYYLVFGLTYFIYLKRKEDVIYSQIRYGKNMAQFTMYKFTTMIHAAESLSAKECLKKDIKDPRILGWWGTFLRKSSLNELPQRKNIKNLEMTVFGPRAYPIKTHQRMLDLGAERRNHITPGGIPLSHVIEYNYNISIPAIAFFDVLYVDLYDTRYKTPLDILTLWYMIRVIIRMRNK